MVILIHGSFARDAAWPRPGSSLRRRIERDAPGALTFYQFQWSGKNTHRARLEAGRSFATYLRDVKTRHTDARIVAITHSHGGNVVLYAAKHLEIDRYLDGMVSLGAPFVHVRPRDVTQYARTLDLCLHAIRFVLWLLAFTMIVYLLSAYTFARPIPALPVWLADSWSPSLISPGWRWFVFAPLLVLFGLYYCLAGMFHFILLLGRAEYAQNLPRWVPSLLNGSREDAELGPFERWLLPRLKCWQATVVEELSPPTIEIDSFLAVIVHRDEARTVLRNIDGVANLSFVISQLVGLLLSFAVMLLIYPFFVMFPAGFIAVPFLIWDSGAKYALLYFLAGQCGLVLLYFLLSLTLWTLPHIRKLGFFGERLTDYLVTHITVSERPQTAETCLASYKVLVPATAREGVRTSRLKHSCIYDDAAVLDDLAEWLWHGHEPKRCSSFARARRLLY